MERKSLLWEVKSLDETGTFSGAAAVFGNVDSYGDIIHAGAFAQTLNKWTAKKRPIPLLWQHDATKPIGAIISATEGAKGLEVEGKLLLGSAQAKEAYEALAAGVLGGMSIGYSAIKSRMPDGAELKSGASRILEEVRLYEVSLVTFPANEDATIDQVKQLGDMEREIKTLRDELQALRDGHGVGHQDPAESAEKHSEGNAQLQVLLAQMRDFTTARRR